MGKLFVIDGTDGSGKQTQFEFLKKHLEEDGIEYKSVSFPNYDSPSSGLVKMYLNGEFGTNSQDISPYVASSFYAADRFATYQKELKGYYENGDSELISKFKNTKAYRALVDKEKIKECWRKKLRWKDV